MPKPDRSYRVSPLNQDPEAVTRAREWARMTRTQLAARAGISLSLMSEIESGIRNATPEKLGRIADALNCPVSMLERKRENVA